ncbi:extracellular solute-binding protein [Cohnella sp. GCM10020058]|uniref:extracellular solute-binding protein n=1 Tax=Cohnella sp. GCM10020058 TaxID=3317330 RepID=UPI003635740B
MKKSIRSLAVLFVFAFLSVAILACSKNNSADTPTATGTASQPGTNQTEESKVYTENGLPKDKEVTIKVGFFENAYGRAWFDTAVKLFTEKYPNVKIDITSSPDIGKLIDTRIAAKNDNDMFDLFFPVASGAGTMQQVIDAGKLEPLEELFDRELIGEPGKTLRSVLSPTVVESMRSTTSTGTDGHSYSLPLGSYSAGLFYNENLFDEKGWNKNPKTWDEFVSLMETIKQAGIIPITFPGVYPEYLTSFTFDLIPFALADQQGKFQEFSDHYRSYALPTFTDEFTKEEYNRIYEFGKKGYFPAGVAALNHTQSQMQVLQGKAAMVSSGDWIGTEMKDATPEGFKWGFMGVPATNEPNGKIYVKSVAATNSMVVWKNKPELQKKWAKELLLFLYNFDVMKEMAKAGIYPARLDYGDDPSRVAALAAAPAAIAKYATNNNVVFYGPERKVVVTSSAATQALKTISESVTGWATGKKEVLPALEKAEGFMKKAWDEQKK